MALISGAGLWSVCHRPQSWPQHKLHDRHFSRTQWHRWTDAASNKTCFSQYRSYTPSPSDSIEFVAYLHRVPKKTKQICFCQNFVKFPPISIIFGRKMGNDPNIHEVHSFSTSPNLCHHLTVLNANVPNCYITPKLLVIDRSHWWPQFIRGHRTFRDH